jgi:hypothetical protein
LLSNGPRSATLGCENSLHHRIRLLSSGPSLARAASVAGARDRRRHRAEQLFQRAIGFSHEVEKVVQSGGKPVTVKYTERYPSDTTALVFWLKNRQRGRWRDKVEPEATVSDEFIAEFEASGERARNYARNRG